MVPDAFRVSLRGRDENLCPLLTRARYLIGRKHVKVLLGSCFVLAKWTENRTPPVLEQRGRLRLRGSSGLCKRRESDCWRQDDVRCASNIIQKARSRRRRAVSSRQSEERSLRNSPHPFVAVRLTPLLRQYSFWPVPGP